MAELQPIMCEEDENPSALDVMPKSFGPMLAETVKRIWIEAHG